MKEDALRELIHQVNNLLAVIEVQAVASRAVGTAEAARNAVEIIARAAERTGETMRRVVQVRP